LLDGIAVPGEHSLIDLEAEETQVKKFIHGTSDGSGFDRFEFLGVDLLGSEHDRLGKFGSFFFFRWLTVFEC